MINLLNQHLEAIKSGLTITAYTTIAMLVTGHLTLSMTLFYYIILSASLSIASCLFVPPEKKPYNPQEFIINIVAATFLAYYPYLSIFIHAYLAYYDNVFTSVSQPMDKFSLSATCTILTLGGKSSQPIMDLAVHNYPFTLLALESVAFSRNLIIVSIYGSDPKPTNEQAAYQAHND